MGVKRAMVVFENRSNLPEDRVVNTFHFGIDTPGSAIHTALQAFYNPATGTKLSTFINDRILRTANKTQTRVYDLADPMPREAEVFTWAPAAASGGVNLPNELSGCVSYYADRNLKRQRGRVYIGPLHNGAIESDAAGPDMRLSSSFITALKDAGAALVSDTGTQWVVWSDMDGVGRPVTNIWVDNAVDIQRRRGAAASSRTVWP